MNDICIPSATSSDFQLLKSFSPKPPDDPDPKVCEQHKCPEGFYTLKGLGELPPQTWLIPNEIPAGGLTMMYGASGIGKSFLALDYAFKVAAKDQLVIYVAAEGGSGYLARGEAYVQHYGHSGEGILFRCQPLELLNPQAVKAFYEDIRSLKPALIILDTWARCIVGGDENSQKDTTQAVEACAQLQRRLNAAVLVVHHTGKKGDAERGSSVLFGACESVIALTKTSGKLKVRCVKSKDSEPFEPRFVRLTQVSVQIKGESKTSCILLSSEQTVESEIAISPQQSKVLKALNEYAEEGARYKQLVDDTGIADSSIDRPLKVLKAKGYLIHDTKAKLYIITTKGQQAINSLTSLA